MSTCPNPATLIESRIDRVLTQYRESPKLLHVLRTNLGQVAAAIGAICSIPEKFDIETAVGDQLTIVGKRLGWPRCHCVCDIQPVFGFACDVPTKNPIGGFCDGTVTWSDCGPFGVSELCLSDDDVYRAFLLVRRYQMLSLYDLASLNEAVRLFWGPTARVLAAGNRRVVIAPGRALTSVERALLQLYPRVLPVAPGIRIRFHFGALRVFGFGTGWGGFCEPWLPDGTELATENETLTTETGDVITVGPLTRGAPWLCEIDANAYDCASR